MKQEWIAPAVEILDMMDTEYTYRIGYEPDGGEYEEKCDPAGPTYS